MEIDGMDWIHSGRFGAVDESSSVRLVLRQVSE